MNVISLKYGQYKSKLHYNEACQLTSQILFTVRGYPTIAMRNILRKNDNYFIKKNIWRFFFSLVYT